jgi:Lon protease-like protein
MRPERIPLFPLNVVLFPGEQLPLHIFEPRYRKMVRECLDNKTPFGMLLAMSDGIVRVGCTAEILEVIKSHEDGRMDIITVGREVFRILQLFDDNPLLEGHVDYLEDREPPSAPKTQQLIELYETCHTIIFADLPKNLEQTPLDQLSYSIASALPMDLLWKQQILEQRSEADRQERLLAYLRDWAPHLQTTETFRTRAAGNGRGMN